MLDQAHDGDKEEKKKTPGKKKEAKIAGRL
jgi:hypothetical protein